jgi:hypothetical protein
MTHVRILSGARRLAVSLLGLLALAAVAPASALAQADASGAPDASMGPIAPKVAPCEPVDPASVATCLALAVPVEADPTLQDPQPVPFDHVTVGPDGTTLVVYFWMGAEPCTGLYGVEAKPIEDGIDLTILVGSPQDAASMTCIAIAELRSTVVTLDQPLVVAGPTS